MTPPASRRRRFLKAALVPVVAIATSVLAVTPALAAPNFKAPFACGQRWTYDHHSSEVRRALDFVRADGGATDGAPVLASASGQAYRFSQPGGAGNYIAIEHGGGWKTYYFHLSSYAVGNNVPVGQGQVIGFTGSTGASSGPHIHYEQLLNGVGQNIVINGQGLSYPPNYNTAFLTSDNGCSIAPMGKIGEKWNALGGNNSVVGKPITGEQDSRGGGKFQQFERGIIIWHPEVGAHAVHGQILDEFWATDSEAAWGFPTMDELPAAAAPSGIAGRFQYFQRGLILWTAQHRAFVVHGKILEKFEVSGREQALGYPTMRELDAAVSPVGTTGRFQYFTDSLFLWSAQHGAHILTGEIERAFAANGREAALGYPTSDASTAGGTVTQQFERSTISWSAGTGAVITRR